MTARAAVSTFSASQIASIRRSAHAGLSSARLRRDRFDLCRDRTRGFTPAGHRQVQLKLDWRSLGSHEICALFALSFNPSSGTVRAFAGTSRLLRPLLTSASRSARLAALLVRHRTRCRSPGVSPTAFLAHPPDLQPWPLMDMDFAISCPLVRPVLPRIRFLFVGSRFCSTLPSDGPSRFRPCVSLALHLHQVAQGTSTPKLPAMSGTQDGPAGHRRRRRAIARP